jgi:flagellar biosynthesis protein
MSKKRGSEESRAVAIRYEPDEDGAPRVMAKGRGWQAEAIIELARASGVPIHEDRALVEVLSKLDLEQEIPPEFYQIVAEILAFVYRMNGKWQEVASGQKT